ncbi:MAG: hypothetical protein AAFY31_11115 [Pseudomonadota bacterium]
MKAIVLNSSFCTDRHNMELSAPALARIQIGSWTEKISNQSDMDDIAISRNAHRAASIAMFFTGMGQAL